MKAMKAILILTACVVINGIPSTPTQDEYMQNAQVIARFVETEVERGEMTPDEVVQMARRMDELHMGIALKNGRLVISKMLGSTALVLFDGEVTKNL